MKNVHDVLQQKEAELERVRREIESLQVAAELLSDEIPPDELTADETLSAQKERDLGNVATISTNAIFSSIAAPRPSFWKALKRGK